MTKGIDIYNMTKHYSSSSKEEANNVSTEVVVEIEDEEDVPNEPPTTKEDPMPCVKMSLGGMPNLKGLVV